MNSPALPGLPRKWDFRRRSLPRKLAQRSQDDVSLNKLPQMNIFMHSFMHLYEQYFDHFVTNLQRMNGRVLAA